MKLVEVEISDVLSQLDELMEKTENFDELEKETIESSDRSNRD